VRENIDMGEQAASTPTRAMAAAIFQIRGALLGLAMIFTKNSVLMARA
jgi:hypothetical protein